ncbi:MOSC domain-containing protein [Mycolicibacterium sp. F2034L]|uniref:MOSC domain-containing protein n=1 Tax=Mycolicibacterium sp. F2034L TaxID=2926422 RepID=UPI001FF56034|nr:MOSC N-terminal beta barrel domain-containing protein [Mycolicibacterium sp. F2034L]MCK0176785.1 MOSC N-terminal beta barrel domain-containing protein [Mycolicibacterium sp. F2034L]
MRVGQVTELWRYPVKSLGGERIERADIGAQGVLGDRLWAVRDVGKDITATARRIPVLLTATARYCAPPPPDAGPGRVPDVEITFPDGTVLRSDDPAVHDKLSELAGREMRLTALPPKSDTSLHRLGLNDPDNSPIASMRSDFGIADGERLPDLSMMRIADLALLARYSTPPGMFVDLAPVHVMSTTSLATIGAELGEGDVDVRRFRPNVLLALDGTDTSDGLPEHRWTGGRLTVGGAVLEVTMPTVRCVVPSRAQPGLDVDRRITKAVATKAGRCLGSYCWVETGGTVSIGDDAAVQAHRASVLTDVTKRAKRVAFGVATAAMERLSR